MTPHERETHFLRGFFTASDPQSQVLKDYAAVIEAARARASTHTTRSGDPLRILLVGYVGAGNTGADLRAIEIAQQLKRLLGTTPYTLSLLPAGTLLDHPVLRGLSIVHPARTYWPLVLEEAVAGADVVINVEGSTYTSTFSDALSGMLIAAPALACARGACGIAYGVDSGRMSPALAGFASRQSQGVKVFTRSEHAHTQLHQLSIPNDHGADAAWHHHIEAPHDANRWVLCPNNPFRWPVVMDIQRAMSMLPEDEEQRYGEFFFFSWDEERAQRYRRYVDEFALLAESAMRLGKRPVLVAMEAIDAPVCRDIAACISMPIDIVARGAVKLERVVKTVAGAGAVISTRFHAALVGLSHGAAVAGISLDERVPRLLHDAGRAHASFWCTDAFAHPVLDALAAGCSAESLERTAALRARQLALFDTMGEHLASMLPR